MGVKRARPAAVLEAETFNRSNTAPLCDTCGYRTLAIDRCRNACRHCGGIVHDEHRIVQHLVATFGGRIVWELRPNADRTA